MQQKNLNSCVLDASSLLAFIHKEPGYNIVAEYLNDSPIISSVNFCEVLTEVIKNGINTFVSKPKLLELVPDIIDFDVNQASIAAELQPHTKRYGLSFADRACLALGKQMNLPVVTADKVWKELDCGVEIILIR